MTHEERTMQKSEIIELVGELDQIGPVGDMLRCRYHADQFPDFVVIDTVTHRAFRCPLEMFPPLLTGFIMHSIEARGWTVSTEEGMTSINATTNEDTDANWLSSPGRSHTALVRVFISAVVQTRNR